MYEPVDWLLQRGVDIMTVGSSSLTSYFNFRTVGVKNMADASVFSEKPSNYEREIFEE
jgi:hypothetical protein